MRTFRVHNVIVLGIFLCLYGVACNPFVWRERGLERVRSAELARQVSDQIYVGMPRNEVESIANELAWIQYKCEVTSRDIYLFGSHDPELTGILSLTYETTVDGELLYQIATFESYFLDNSTANCEAVLLS